jgi:hypothetical protein
MAEAEKTADRYGVCTRTVERWEKSDPTFPKPMIRNGRKYDNDEKLDVWDAECVARDRAARKLSRRRRPDGRDVS